MSRRRASPAHSRLPYVLAFASLAVCAWLVWAGDPAVAPRPSAVSGMVVQDHSGGRDVAPIGTGVQGPRAMPVGLHSPAERSTQEITPVPNQLGLWDGRPLAVADRTVEILETDDVSLMEYRLGKEPPVWFAQVAGLGNRAAFHPPEVCYVGSHYQVVEREPIAIIVNGQSRQVMRLVVAKGAEQFETWYWFTADKRVTPNYYQQQLWLTADSIRRRPMSGTLVRISTPIEESHRAHRRLLAFVTSWDTLIIQSQGPHGS